jgi:hypothetical protein
LRYKTLANVALGATLAAAAGTVVLYLFTDFGGSRSVAAAPVAGGGVAVLRGAF